MFDFGPNDLWLELTGITNTNVSLTLHGTFFFIFQVFSKTNLDQAEWRPGEMVFNFLDLTNIVFQPVPMEGQPKTFYRAEGSDTVLDVTSGCIPAL